MHCVGQQPGGGGAPPAEKCAYNFKGGCAAPASYLRCRTDADCAVGGENHSCHGMLVRCNSTQFCTNGQRDGEICNTSAGLPHSAPGPGSRAGLSPGPACAGPNDGLLEVQMAVARDGRRYVQLTLSSVEIV